MGLLDIFTKKKDSSSGLDLDAPPMPPSAGGDLGFPPTDNDLSIPKHTGAPSTPPAPIDNVEEELQEFDIPSVKPENPASIEEQSHFDDEPIEGPVRRKRSRYSFVNANDFKTVLKDINLIKNNITGAHQYISELHDSEAKKEAHFKGLHNSVVDIQKKIVTLDKNLFEKGDTYG